MRGLRVRKGKLLKSERDIERYARDWVEREHRGLYFDTKAEWQKRNGAPAFPSGTLDGIGIIPLGLCEEGRAIVIVFEWKRDRAKTAPLRLAKQTATVMALRMAGLLVYQAPEDCEDVIGHFREWARENGL